MKTNNQFGFCNWILSNYIVLLVSVSILIILLTAGSCGSNGGSSSFTLEVNNQSPSITEGASKTVTVTIKSTGGFSGPVNLTINNPTEVTASFNPASATNASTLTLSSDKKGSYPMTITGKSGNLTKTAPITLTVNENPNKGFTLFVNDQNLTITEGESKNVTVTITPTGGFKDSVNLTINNPADVTASFTPTSTTSTSALTLSSSKANTYNMTITGTGGGITQTTPITLTITKKTPETITVKGTVVGENKQPMGNIPVVIMTQTATTGLSTSAVSTTQTDSDGKFVLTNVNKPYDALIVIQGPPTTVLVYKGLIRTDPTLMFIGQYPTDSLNSVSLEGKVSGGQGYPHDNTYADAVAFAASGVVAEKPKIVVNSDVVGVNDTTGGFKFGTIEWFGGTETPSITGVVHALQWKKGSNGLPENYTGYGKKENITLNVKPTTTAIIPVTTPIILQNILTGTMGVVIKPPTNYDIKRKLFYVKPDNNARIQVADVSNSDGTFDFIYPKITGGSSMILVEAQNNIGDRVRTNTVISNGSTSVDITLPAAPSQKFPVGSGSNIDHSTTFSWSPFDNGVHLLQYREETNPPITYWIITDKSEVKIPDLSEVNIGIDLKLKANTSYEWQVWGFGSASNMNEATNKNWNRRSAWDGYIEGSYGHTPHRKFTTNDLN